MRLGLCQRRLAALAAKDDDRNALERRLAGVLRAGAAGVPAGRACSRTRPRAGCWIKRRRRSGRGDAAGCGRSRPANWRNTRWRRWPCCTYAAGCARRTAWRPRRFGCSPARRRQVRQGVDRATPPTPSGRRCCATSTPSPSRTPADTTRRRAILKEIMDDASRPECGEARLVWGEGMLAEGARQDRRGRRGAAEQSGGRRRRGRPKGPRGRREDRPRRRRLHGRAGRQHGRFAVFSDPASASFLRGRVGVAVAHRRGGRRRPHAHPGGVEEGAKGADGQTPDPPDVPLTDVPLQPAEKKARAAYEALIAAQPDLLPLAAQARLELAKSAAAARRADRGRRGAAQTGARPGAGRRPVGTYRAAPRPTASSRPATTPGPCAARPRARPDRCIAGAGGPLPRRRLAGGPRRVG